MLPLLLNGSFWVWLTPQDPVAAPIVGHATHLLKSAMVEVHVVEGAHLPVRADPTLPMHASHSPWSSALLDEVVEVVLLRQWYDPPVHEPLPSQSVSLLHWST
jgi:hypothetical protein